MTQAPAQTPQQIMAAIMNKPPTPLQMTFLQTIAQAAPQQIRSTVFQNPPHNWPPTRIRGVHSRLAKWAEDRYGQGSKPWSHGDGEGSVPAWYQMTAAVAAVVLPPPPAS